MRCFNVTVAQVHLIKPGRVAQSVGHLTRKSGVLGSYPVWQHTFVSPSAFSRRAVVSYWRKYVHEVLVDRLGSLSLPRKSVVRLTDRPDITLDVYRGRKTTIQHTTTLIKIQTKCIFRRLPSKMLQKWPPLVARQYSARQITG